MSDSKISRRNRDFDITTSTATATATTLDFRDVAGAVVSFGTMSTNAASLQIWVGNSSSGTFRRLYKADGSVADITLAPSSTEGRVYALPDEAFAAAYVRVVAGSTNSAGVSGVVMLKS